MVWVLEALNKGRELFFTRVFGGFQLNCLLFGDELIYREEPSSWLPLKAYRRPWFDIATFGASFLCFVRFKAVNGQTIKFWKDVWLKDTPLESLFSGFFKHLSQEGCSSG